jgi:predicted nucleic-acid-binding Zn-ribbon protein
MKVSRQCPKCESRKIGYINYQPDASGTFMRWRVIAQVRKPEAFGTRWPRLGELEAYVCTECGYYESYVKDPASTPWDQLSGFRLINPDGPPDGPYR